MVLVQLRIAKQKTTRREFVYVEKIDYEWQS
jgi:hypothetical protein